MKTFECTNCGKSKATSHRSTNTYCSIKCQQNYQRVKKVKAFLAGKYVGKKLLYRSFEWTRKLVEETYGSKCNECGISKWKNKNITLEVNHIDGKAYNNTLKNLELLCPNCHSQTSTFRNKNRGKSERINR